jgi:hypothetical protein
MFVKVTSDNASLSPRAVRTRSALRSPLPPRGDWDILGPYGAFASGLTTAGEVHDH